MAFIARYTLCFDLSDHLLPGTYIRKSLGKCREAPRSQVDMMLRSSHIVMYTCTSLSANPSLEMYTYCLINGPWLFNAACGRRPDSSVVLHSCRDQPDSPWRE